MIVPSTTAGDPAANPDVLGSGMSPENQPPPPRSRKVASLRAAIATLACGRVLASVLSAVWFLVAARTLTTASLGDLALLLSLGAIFGMASDAGLTVILQQTAAFEPGLGRRAWTAVLRRRLPLAVLASVGLTGAYAAASAEGSLIVPLVFAVSLVATSIHTTGTAVLRALGQPRVDAVNEVASRFAVLAAGSIWLTHGGGLRAAVIVYAASDVVSAAAVSRLCRGRLERSDRVLDTARFGMRQTFPLAVTVVLGTIYYRVDVWLLAVLGQGQAVATYSVAYRVFDAVMLPTTAVAAFAIPAFARRRERSSKEQAGRLVGISLLLTVPTALIVLVGTPRIVDVLFGPRYADAEGPLRVLMVGAAASAVASVMAQVRVIGHRGLLVRVTLGALALNVCANLIVIPHFGAVGAAWTTVGCQTLVALALWFPSWAADEADALT